MPIMLLTTERLEELLAMVGDLLADRGERGDDGSL